MRRRLRELSRIVRPTLVGIVVATLVVPSAAVAAGPPPVAAVVPPQLLGTFGGDSSLPHDLNNAGEVVGQAQAVDGQIHAFRWHRGVLTDLGVLGEYSSGNAINERGVVVGTSQYRAVMWRGDAMTVLVDRNESGSAGAWDINDRNEVIGVRYLPTSYMYGQGFLWRNGHAVDLPGIGGDTYPAKINNRGEIVGFVETGQGATTNAALWRNGQLTVISPPGAIASLAHDINERGQVIGGMVTSSGTWHYFLWDDGVITDLGTLNTVGINNRGEIAGNPDGVADALPVRWHRGRVTELPSLGGIGSKANAINSVGAVAGYSGASDGRHGVVWTRTGRIIDLGPLKYGTHSGSVWYLNDRGLVAGVLGAPGGGSQAAVWDTAVADRR
ncbi:hypothetical protein [Micromonospora sp. NBC_01813]|uniref:hypothetical protein n=1 Tax=Micromonospora sp. NBC_01813 TaxID=2975988 RepID=UPI002DDC3F6F|nr:hypothetical protein [Micromonospora sp. NBC_01813]WSA07507.1 hypothetical protein OG958_25145 [Micromonospora sp. NBC_01813]